MLSGFLFLASSTCVVSGLEGPRVLASLPHGGLGLPGVLRACLLHFFSWPASEGRSRLLSSITG